MPVMEVTTYHAKESWTVFTVQYSTVLYHNVMYSMIHFNTVQTMQTVRYITELCSTVQCIQYSTFQHNLVQTIWALKAFQGS